jgi:phage/plasmid primase-like uncharacterized protein/RecA-family ATPase
MSAVINPHDVSEQFRDFALSKGITLPDTINIDTPNIQTFKIDGKDKGRYKLHSDGIPAGFLQDHSGEKYNWTYDNPNYKPPVLTKEQRDQQAKAKQAKAELNAKQQADNHAAAAEKAAFIWQKSTPLTDTQNHEYLINKGIKGVYSIRVNDYDGKTSLVIPVGKDGKISTLQFINADGSKRLLPNGKKSGCYSILNKRINPKVIAIAEGYATIASILDNPYSQKIGYMGVMAIDAGNLEQVAIAMRELYPQAAIILFGDKGDKDGKGEKLAHAAAVACNGYCVLPPIEKGDFNDYLTSGAVTVSLENLVNAVCGSDDNKNYDDYSALDYDRFNDGHTETPATLNTLTPTTTQPSPKENKRMFTPIGELIKKRVCPSWLIRGYLPLNSTCMLYGASGAGKSFLMLDMALHIANGKEWQGQKTKQGAVFYIAGEGQDGITARAQVWALHHGIDIDNSPFYCTEGAVIPTNEMELAMLIEDVTNWVESTGETPVLIVFDTLARCFDGNENSSQDAGQYIKAKDRIKQAFKCCVMSVHHAGKDDLKGGRGSSAFKGAWDAEHSLTIKDDGTKQLHTSKLKESLPLPDKFFNLESVYTGWIDDDNEPVYSAVMVNSDYTPSKKEKGLTDRQRDVLAELHKAIELHGIETTSDIKARFPDSPYNIPKKVVSGEKWKALAYPVIATTNKTKAFGDCITQLLALGKIAYYDGFYWIGY